MLQARGRPDLRTRVLCRLQLLSTRTARPRSSQPLRDRKHTTCRPRHTSARRNAEVIEPTSHVSKRERRSATRLAPQGSNNDDRLLLVRVEAERPPSFATASPEPHSFACRAKFENGYRFFELRHGAQHLPYEHACRIATFGSQVRAARVEYADATLAELPDDHFTHHQVASESVCTFDDDETHAVVFQPIEQCREARA